MREKTREVSGHTLHDLPQHLVVSEGLREAEREKLSDRKPLRREGERAVGLASRSGNLASAAPGEDAHMTGRHRGDEGMGNLVLLPLDLHRDAAGPAHLALSAPRRPTRGAAIRSWAQVGKGSRRTLEGKRHFHRVVRGDPRSEGLADRLGRDLVFGPDGPHRFRVGSPPRLRQGPADDLRAHIIAELPERVGHLPDVVMQGNLNGGHGRSGEEKSSGSQGTERAEGLEKRGDQGPSGKKSTRIRSAQALVADRSQKTAVRRPGMDTSGNGPQKTRFALDPPF